MNVMPPELMLAFAAMLSERIRYMRSTVAAGEITAIRTVVHQIAGTGGSFGFESLTEEGRRLEGDLCAGVATEAAILDFIALCEDVLSQVRRAV